MEIEQLRKLTPKIRLIAQKHGIKKIYVFGSIARGDASAQSDVDLLVEMNEGASLFGVAGFTYEMEQLIGIRVDVVPLSILANIKDQDFSQNIKREAVSL